MRIEADAVIPFDRETVFQAYRDEMQDFVDYLPNVRGIEVQERKEDGARVDLVNVWHGGGEIPAPLSKIVGTKALSWTDVACWLGDDWRCQWRIETHAFTEAVSCKGMNNFIELEGGRTRLEIQGEIAIDMKRVRGVPKFLAASLGPKIEKFLVRQITTNLTSVSGALTRYLEQRQAS